MRRSKAIRATAWGVVAVGVVAPLVRRRVAAPPIAMQAVAFCAPVGLCVAVRRSRARDVATCCLQMWAYVAAYKSPNDDPVEQARRVRIDYPIAIDRVVGLGELPTVRLQRALARVGPEGPRWRALDKVLVWTHWSWFMVPHGAMAYILLCHRRRFGRAAVMTYAVFDIGAMIYWVLPTAPPWYAAAAPERGVATAEHDAATSVERYAATAEHDAATSAERYAATAEHDAATSAERDAATAERYAATAERGVAAEGCGEQVAPRRDIAVRRMMVEYGQSYWGERWTPLYSVLGGNPLAAMPSLHFATSVMAALLLAENGAVAGAVGWAYASTLGFALVYLGEHYVADLLAGAALTMAVRRVGPCAAPAVERCGRAVASLEAKAHRAG